MHIISTIYKYKSGGLSLNPICSKLITFKERDCTWAKITNMIWGKCFSSNNDIKINKLCYIASLGIVIQQISTFLEDSVAIVYLLIGL